MPDDTHGRHQAMKVTYPRNTAIDEATAARFRETLRAIGREGVIPVQEHSAPELIEFDHPGVSDMPDLATAVRAMGRGEVKPL